MDVPELKKTFFHQPINEFSFSSTFQSFGFLFIRDHARVLLKRSDRQFIFYVFA
jgi:hypothetical protein